MKFLVDAQLPRKLSKWLIGQGHDSKHTLDLERKNDSTDAEIIQIADLEDRIVISKDSDFLDDHILYGRPKQLLVVSTGNIKNSDLIQIFDRSLEQVTTLFNSYDLIELTTKSIITHERK